MLTLSARKVGQAWVCEGREEQAEMWLASPSRHEPENHEDCGRAEHNPATAGQASWSVQRLPSLVTPYLSGDGAIDDLL